MPTNNSLLTDISQLDELNKEVWADSVREREITQRVKPKFGDISSPSQNIVNEPESKATEILPLWNKRRNEVGVSETVVFETVRPAPEKRCIGLLFLS